MTHIRIRSSIHLNGDHTLTPANLNDIKADIERAIASALPDYIAVDTVRITRIREATPAQTDAADA